MHPCVFVLTSDLFETLQISAVRLGSVPVHCQFERPETWCSDWAADGQGPAENEAWLLE